MANIDKLNYSFVDGQTTIHDYHLNDFVDRINRLIDAVGGSTPTQTVAAPTISISGTTATITCSTSGATIRYAIDGTPTESSGTIIASGGTINLSSYNTQKTIRAIAYKSGMTTSQVAQATYTPSASYDSDAQAIMNRYTKSLSTAKKDAFNTFIVSLKNAGVYSKIDYLILPCLANDVNEAVINALDGTACMTNPTSLTFANGGIKPIIGQEISRIINTPFNNTNVHISFFNNNAATPLTGKWDEALSGSSALLGFGKGINAKGIGAYVNLTTGGQQKYFVPSAFDDERTTAKTHAIFSSSESGLIISANGTVELKSDDTLASGTETVSYTFGQASGIQGGVYREVTSEVGVFGGGSVFSYGLLTIGKALTQTQCAAFNNAVTTFMDIILA